MRAFLMCFKLCTVHDRPIYIVYPDVLSKVGETSYGIRVGFFESYKVLTIFYLFICI